MGPSGDSSIIYIEMEQTMTTAHTYSTLEQKTIADTILTQLGGTRFTLMTGARKFCFDQDESGVSLSFKHTLSNKMNYCKITLTKDDVYSIEFGLIRGINYTVKAEEIIVYSEDLRTVFAKITGLDTHL